MNTGIAARMGRIVLRSVVVLALASAALGGGAAHGQCTQAGPFTPFAQPWRDGFNTVGFMFPNGTTMVVDTDGDGVTSPGDPADRVYALPAEIQGTRFINALSPTREFFVVVGGQAPGGCDANRTVRTYRLNPADSTMSLVHQDCLPCTVFEGPLFYDLGAVPPNPFPPPITPQRIMMFRTGTAALCSPSNLATPLLRWYDLTTPGPSGIGESTLGLGAGVGQIRVSPSGYQAFIQHDLTQNPADADYDIINLCPGPQFGAIVLNAIGPRINDHTGFPLPVPLIAAADAANVVVQMTRGTGGEVLFEAMLPNCCAGGGPTGACCINGGCLITTEAQCAGTWIAGASCAGAGCPPPPAPILSISKTGPATVFQQDFVDYVITYRNDGGAAAESVTVRDRLPFGLTFVSAGNGGVYNESQQAVTWTIGTLPAESGARTLTLRCQTGCSLTQHTNSDYRINATGMVAFGQTAVQTLVVPAPLQGNVTGSVVTSGPAEPLVPGAVLRHEITLTNPAGADLTDIRFTGYAGLATRFTTLVSGGTGTLSMPFGGGSYLEWTGSLAAGQTTLIVFESTVNECSSAENSQTQLNHGQNWTVSTPCGAQLGSIPTSRVFRITPPVSARLRAATQPGIVGPVSPGNPIYTSPMQFVRGTPDLDLELTIENHTGATITAASISLEIPFSWITADPPFSGQVPAGASFDVPTNSVLFNGDIPPQGVGPIVFRTRPNAPIDGAQYFYIYRNIPAMCTIILGSLDLVNLPEFPTGPVIVGTDKFFRAAVWTLRPGIDAEPVEYFRRAETWFGLHKDASGGIWIAGGPLFMFNPITLEADSFAAAEEFVSDLGLFTTNARDIALDPVDGSVVFLVEGRTVNGAPAPPALIRYDRATGACTLITRDPAIQPRDGHADVQIDGAGAIYICNRDRLFRIDRATPTPIPAGGVPVVNVPAPQYALAADAGIPGAHRVHAASPACDGTLYLLHATDFTGGQSPEGVTVTTTVYAVGRFDPAIGASTILQSQAAATAINQWERQLPAAFTPQLPALANLADSCIAEGEIGQVLVGNDYYPYHCIYAFDAAGIATAIEPAEQWHIRSAADMIYMNAGCGAGPSCDSDVNCDGVPDQGDVACMVLAVAGDITCFCQADPDFNRDGVPDQGDIADVILVVAGAPCP